MADYRALVANCLIRSRIQLQLCNLDIGILPRSKYINAKVSDLKEKSLYTTDIIIRNLAKENFEHAQLTVRYITELLSFATCSDVVQFGFDYPERAPAFSRNSIIGQIQYHRPLFNIILKGEVIKAFLEQTWQSYQSLRKERQLDIVRHYYVLAEKPSQPIELKLVLLFVLLENLKHTFAVQQGYPFIKGSFRNQGATSSKRGRLKGFKCLMNEMFAAVFMSPDVSKVIKLRNELIHSGILVLSFREKKDIYEFCQDIIREYLLRLLDYKGEYLSYSSSIKAIT